MSTVIESFPLKESLRKAARTATLQVGLKWSAACLLVFGIGWVGMQRNWFGGATGASTASLVTYEVQPRDLPITVIERGDLESQTNIPVFCEVDDFRSDGISGVPIVWIIPNGSSVSEGELICELDSTAIQSELDEQTLDTEEARSALFQAKANLDNQVIQNITAETKANLDVDLARLAQEMFTDENAGSHTLALDAIHRQIDDLNNEILTAWMNMELAKNEKLGIESLFELGYAGKSELDRAELSFLRSEGEHAAKLNKLKTQLASLEKLNRFDKRMQLLELTSKLETSEQELQQVKLSNTAKMKQMEGIHISRIEQLKKEEERLARYQEQYAKCKIYAPQSGMIAYAPPSSSRDTEIGEGVPVRQRQHILSIPNLQKMEVRTKVHESVLDRIQVGLPVAITVDAFPERQYSGTVKSVAVLPERSYYSDSKTYQTVITIDEDVYQLKPGMTAVGEIKVDYLAQVNAVPVQAIVQRSGVNWLYVEDSGDVQRRRVTLGQSNDQFVSVVEGLAAGERVVLNPATLLNDEDEDELATEQIASVAVASPQTLVAQTDSNNAIN